MLTTLATAGARVAQATWPATDELKNPYYGYTERPLRVFAVENFKHDALAGAAAQKSEYDAALLFSTHGRSRTEPEERKEDRPRERERL